MKTFINYLLVITFLVSCNNNNQELSPGLEKSKILHWDNQYEAFFDEPSSRNIAGMKFYILVVSSQFMDTLTILSIRQDSSKLQGFYKQVPYDQVQTLQSDFTDTNSFKYSTIRFKPTVRQIESIKNIIKTNDLFNLKDSVQTAATDGIKREMIIYVDGKFCDLYRSYVFEREIEPIFISSFKDIMRFIPREPVPFYKR